MARRLIAGAVCAVALGALGLYAYNWFTPNSPADLARVGQCAEYRAAMERLEAGLDSETQADPAEIQLVLDECDRQGH